MLFRCGGGGGGEGGGSRNELENRNGGEGGEGEDKLGVERREEESVTKDPDEGCSPSQVSTTSAPSNEVNGRRSCAIAKETQAAAQLSFTPLTQMVHLRESGGEETLLQRAERVSGGRFDAREPSCVVGLHTCGEDRKSVV